MKRKAISFIISFILSTSLAVNVKATVVSSPANLNPLTVTNELNEERIQEANKLNIELSDLKDHFNMFIGDDFNQKRLVESLSLDKSLIITIESLIPEGVITEDFSGNHMITFSIKNSAGNHIEHTASLTISGRPQITIKNTKVNSGDVFTLAKLSPEAYDYEDGDISDRIQVLESDIDLNSEISSLSMTSFNLILGVTDNDNNETKLEAIITVNEPVMTPMVMKLQANGSTKTISGNNRYQTATAISNEMYVSANTAILVASENFPDALAAGPLAVSMKAPILLSAKDQLSSFTKDELIKLGVKNVIIMGGENSIGKSIDSELKTMGITTERVFGADRYLTAIATAKRLGETSKIFLASGTNFADAMTAGSYASENKHPIVLTSQSSLTPATEAYLLNSNAEIIIVGGEAAVSKSIETSLRSKGKTITRVFGSNRFTTSVEMAKKFYPTATIAVVASGLNFIDALTAVPYASAMSAPILLTKKDSADEGVTEFLTTSNLSNFHFIGGEAVITPNAKNTIMYPSLYDVSYKTGNISGTWSQTVKNGQTSGDITTSGISLFDIKAEGNKDISIRYGTSVIGSGWQSIVTSGQTGITGKLIDGLVMELGGKDASQFDIFYRVYQSSSWSSWTLGGKVAGVTNGNPIQGIETRIIKGNSSTVNYSLFPQKPTQRSYYTTNTTLNLRVAPDSSSKLITSMHNRADLEVLSITTDTKKNKWAQVKYVNLAGTTYTGYASMAYINSETLVSAAILTLNGLTNGQSIPKQNVQINGDAAYNKGISEINYYINGVLIGKADYGYLTSGGIKQGFDSPQKTGYKINLPATVWDSTKINSLKVEMVGSDGVKEWETIYLGGDSKNILLIEQQNRSFNYFARKEDSQNPATYDQVATYLDPSKWITDPTRKFMFLDVRYSPSDFTVTAEQINKMVVGKGVLDGMGSTILQAAIDFKVNPLYLVAHSILETGHGKSKLAGGQSITHSHTKFGDESSALIPLSAEDVSKKWYNMFGIGAWDRNANLWGVEKAYLEGWDTVEKAIYGATKWISENYVYRAPYTQNTIYKMRYNIDENMSHEYASDTGWAYKQAFFIKKFYDETGVTPVHKFNVPLFDDMRP